MRLKTETPGGAKLPGSINRAAWGGGGRGPISRAFMLDHVTG